MGEEGGKKGEWGKFGVDGNRKGRKTDFPESEENRTKNYHIDSRIQTIS